MSLRVRITWKNPNHDLLREGYRVSLLVDDAPLPVLRDSPGRVVIDVPDGTTELTLSAVFEPALPGKLAFHDRGKRPPPPAVKEEVLRVTQVFEVRDNGTTLHPVPSVDYLGMHPLVNIKQAANRHAAAVIHIDTTFVDISKLWPSYAEFWKEYEEESKKQVPGMRLVPLAFTGGRPLIWFASIPPICTEAREIGCLVFFRPDNERPYSRVDEWHHMWRPARYLLRPRPEPTAFLFSDHFRENPREPGTIHDTVRIGMEHALHESGRRVVMIHPWPSKIDFGIANTARLDGLTHGILRSLWAQQYVGRASSNVRRTRLGLSGYSGGGLSLWGALVSNANVVDELYAFDTQGVKGAAHHLLQWFRARDAEGANPRLRLTGGLQITEGVGVLKTLEDFFQMTVLGPVTVWPFTEEDYDPKNNPWWKHVTHRFPNGPRDLDEHNKWIHQFAIFAGPQIPGDRTFLQLFLEGSEFE